jgi:polysaccharide chain length determinant protein (PEP-CTERM system associated)
MLPGKQYKPADYLAMALRRWWLIALPCVVGVYVSLIYSSRIPDSYQSEMMIQIVPQRVPDAYVRSTVTTRTEERIAAITEQVKSRTELERLITDMDLYPAERSRLPMQDVVERMRGRIVVEPIRARDKDIDSFYVRFTYSNAEMVKQVTERLVSLFVEVNTRDRGNLAQATHTFLQSQLADARRRLEEQDLKLKQFRERFAGRLPTQLQFNMTAMQNSQMLIQAQVESLARDRDRKLTLERMYADVEAEPIIVVPAVAAVAAPAQAAQPVLAGDTIQQLAAMREGLKALEIRFKPDHPDVVRTKSAIQDLEVRLAEEEAAAAKLEKVPPASPPPDTTSATAQQLSKQQRLQALRNDIESLDRQMAFKEVREQQLRTQLAEYESRIEGVPGLESEWISLTRDYSTQENAYKDLLAKSEDAARAAELEQRQIGEVFRILDAARAPTRPIGVNRLEINGYGAAAGLVVGLLLVALLELWDRTIHSADDVADVFHLPVIAMVPQVLSDVERRRKRLQLRLLSTAAVVVAVAGGYGFWVMQLWKYAR